MKSIIVSICIVASFIQCCKEIEPGSYNDTERYRMSASRDKVIKAINIFKTEHPENCPPSGFKLKDGYDKDTKGNDISSWYYVYYYNPDSNRYFNTWVIDDDNSHSVIGLISVKKDSSRWYIVNSELKGSENEAIKQEFVTRILNPIKEILSKQ